MKKNFVHFKKKSEEKCYNCFYNGLGGSVTITDGKISMVSFHQDGRGGGGYSGRPGDSVFHDCRNDIFNLMCKHDTEKFKSMLRFIEDTDSENYQYGLSMLERKKKRATAELQSKIDLISAKFDL